MKRLVVLVLTLTASVFAVRADGSDPSSKSNAKAEDEQDVATDSPAEETTEDPVGYVTGNAFDTAIDLRVPCPDIDLVFGRAYSSGIMRTGQLGYGWTHSYEWRVVETNKQVYVYSAGETGPSDTIHVFNVPSGGSSVFNADGYELRKSRTSGFYSLVTPSARTYAFDGRRLLDSISTWNGTTVRLERDATGRLLRVVHPNGKYLWFEYGMDGALWRVVTPRPGVWVEFLLGSHGMFPTLESVVRHDGDSTSTIIYSYAASPPGIRYSMPDPYGGSLQFALSGNSCRAISPVRLVMTTVPGGRPLLSEKTDANGLAVRFSYIRPNDSQRVWCSSLEMDGGLFATRLSYGAGRTAVRKAVAGGMTEMRLLYDSRNRETNRCTGAEARAREYDARGDMVRERLENRLTGVYVEERRSYDTRHRSVSVGVAYGATPTRRTTMSWDDRRNLPNRIVSPEGRVREWTTNGHDVIVYGAGKGDARAVTTILCDTHDRPYAALSPDGGRTDLSYDAEGYLSRIEAEGLPPVSMVHDALGHVASTTLPGSSGDRVTSFARNWRGKPLTVAYPDGTAESFAYNGTGTRVVRHMDALGREDTYRWIMGLPVHAGRAVDGVTNTLFRVEHDPQLNVVAIIDPLGRNAETYVLDENERVVAVTNVEGQVLERTYAVERLVASETRFDGTAVSYAYDADANLASATYPDGTLAFTYDGDGLRTSASNFVGVVTNEYDAATGWLASSRGADGTEVSYVYSDGGEVTGVVSVAGTTRYALDKASRRTRIDSPAGTMRLGYCAWNGKLAAVTNAHGLAMTYAYDMMDRVTNIAWTAADGTFLGGFSYEYDAAGRIVTRDHTLDGASFNRTYAYDALDRLAADGDVAYTYDAAGNRMTRTENGETTTYTLGAGDRLASWTGGTCTYNAAGCVTRIERDGRPTLDLTWNGQYQLVSVSTNGAFAESYAYDALGRRVSTTTLEGAVRHVYDDSWQCLADIDENGTVLRSYVWGEGIDNLLAMKIGGNVYYPLTDIQGTVWGYVDSQNNIVARWTYDAWGNVLSEDVAVSVLKALRYRFQGREWSAATGLINFRMRWYDANVGRWLSKDSAGLKGGINLFVLCRNDPVNFFDADGCGFLGLFAKTAKMTWKLISRTHAEKMLKKHQTVTMKGKGCGKKAKRLVESATGKKTVRHDGHGPGQAPHYQPKNGGGTHVRVPGAHLTEGMGLFGDAIDFFNPLSDAQDLIDLVQDVVESFD